MNSTQQDEIVVKKKDLESLLYYARVMECERLKGTRQAWLDAEYEYNRLLEVVMFSAPKS